MARESALWGRLKRAGKDLLRLGHKVDLERIENAAGAGHPDVDGCINGGQLQIELKSCDRPARFRTPIRYRTNPRTRAAQSDWHRRRAEAGGRVHWVLIQVGESRNALLYLIAGKDYDLISCPEDELHIMSCVNPAADPDQVLLRAAHGW
jgi:hypothetical protein